ncbi:hypothetical protein FACUT_3506 [Fusarium acutatum]|uniref:Uncharacterized protein n=1 Tax=Fusarium acutatum TaxID=78861 RepID=A0A8H4JXW9_9HYPO|nr:hypothetical protein FACUT_3506 [Fusarium acutatum]
MPTLATLSFDLRIEFNAAKGPVQILVDRMLMSGDIGLGDLDRAKINWKATILAQQTMSCIVFGGSTQAKSRTTEIQSIFTELTTSILSTEIKTSTGGSSSSASRLSSIANSESTTASASELTTTNPTPDPTMSNLYSLTMSTETPSIKSWALTVSANAVPPPTTPNTTNAPGPLRTSIDDPSLAGREIFDFVMNKLTPDHRNLHVPASAQSNADKALHTGKFDLNDPSGQEALAAELLDMGLDTVDDYVKSFQDGWDYACNEALGEIFGVFCDEGAAHELVCSGLGHQENFICLRQIATGSETVTQSVTMTIGVGIASIQATTMAARPGGDIKFNINSSYQEGFIGTGGKDNAWANGACSAPSEKPGKCFKIRINGPK